MIQYLAILIFPSLMVIIAAYDLATMTIPNWVSVALAMGFLLLAPLAGMDIFEIAIHGAVAMGILVITFTLFALGYIGGGDAKVMAASALWIGWGDLLPYLVTVSLLGGLLTLGILLFRQIPLPKVLITQPWISRLHDSNTGIPYGIAIALGGLVVFTDTAIFHVPAA